MSALSVGRSLLAGTILTGFAWMALVAQVAAEAGAAPPDFSSNQAGWIGFGDIVAAPGSPPIVSQDPSHVYVPNNVGRQPTYRMGDISNPNLKPWVKARMKKDNDEVLAGKIGFTARSSCQPGGVPGFALFGVRPVYFLQTPKGVVIIYSGDEQVRHVYLDVTHSKNPAPSWYGESIGHYEDDTLVVDTIGLNDKTVVDNYRTPHSAKIHVVERWKMIDDGQKLQVTYPVDDPDAFNAPWTAIRTYRRVQQAMLDEVCAENNRNLFDYHVPIPIASLGQDITPSPTARRAQADTGVEPEMPVKVREWISPALASPDLML
jgi:hypothetical protein